MSQPERSQARRALVIVNPGARKAAKKSEEARRALQEEGLTVTVVFTEAPGHATELARQHAPNADIVFTLGGDGTAMEVITALAGQGPPVAVLPGGTGNILARSLGTPLRIARAAKALLHGDEARLDLGRLGDGRHFVIGVGVGLDEAMIAGASPLMKKRVGFWAYIWSAMKAGLRMQRFDVRLTVDGKLYERRATSVLIANLGSVLGGVISFGDKILYDDGVLHACVYSPDNLWDALRIFARMLRGTVHDDRCAFYVSGRDFRLETTPQRRAQADGELLEMTPLDITTRPQAARLLIRKQKATQL
ncbi:MAG TPA: diacylglycerol kinase family protein [Gemmatimonadaceae bacterium]|nr:diacylglycerol kinase family protein [Gemmatimonadaceae bacterium]